MNIQHGKASLAICRNLTCSRPQADGSTVCRECGGQSELERLTRIRRVTERMTHGPEDSRTDYDEPGLRAVAPRGWSRRHG